MVHACNPSYSGGWGRRIAWTWKAEVAVSRDRTIALQLGRQSETTSQNKTKSNKKQKEKFSQVWWHKPVIPATQKAEAGELLESGRQRLQWAEIVPLHSSLATEWDFVSKKKRWWREMRFIRQSHGSRYWDEWCILGKGRIFDQSLGEPTEKL